MELHAIERLMKDREPEYVMRALREFPTHGNNGHDGDEHEGLLPFWIKPGQRRYLRESPEDKSEKEG